MRQAAELLREGAGVVPNQPSEPGAAESPSAPGDPGRAVAVGGSTDGGGVDRGSEGLPHIGGYVLERQLGRGGSATVYLARELKHGRKVAVKVLHPVLSASLLADRFLQEIDIVARLAHPNILPLLDSARAGELFYYVTPFVPDESLRRRLDREGRVPVGDAVRIVREVAEALDYAHRQGVVHRDVKPENILLADGHALVADFGIARALSAAGEDRLTTVGLAPGTPRYMSPEQAGGVREIDGRSDIYSLACVLYELLAGAPPFTGETAQDVALKHMTAPVPAVRRIAPDIPRGLERALARAMAKKPDGRYATAGEFAQALTAAVTGASDSRMMDAVTVPGSARRVALIAIAVALAIAITRWMAGRTVTGEALLNESLYVVIPLDSASAAAGPGDLAELIRSGLKRWRDVSVEDEQRSREALADAALQGGGERARRAATALGAAHYIQVGALRRGDSVEVTATLVNTATNQRLTSRRRRIAVNSRDMAAEVGSLTDSVLFADGVPPGRVDPATSTYSLAARKAYFRGHQALANGNFTLADSSFFEATQLDPEYAQPLVWLAHVRSWVHSNSRTWGQLVSRPAAQGRTLGASEQVLREGLRALASEDFSRACAQWERLTQMDSNDFAWWYGLGNCLRRDQIVVPAPRVAGGWRFRSSYHRAVNSFEHAFRLQPSILRGFGGTSLVNLQFLLFTSGARVLTGRTGTADSSQMFDGYPAWHGDSLVFTPLSRGQVPDAQLSRAMAEAIQQQRLRFRDIAAMWRAESPQSADAADAVATSLEMLGDAGALDTLRVARGLATNDTQRLRIAGREVWVRVKFSLPTNQTSLRAAKALADSLLLAYPPGQSPFPRLLGSLAALTGRANLAAAYARQEAGDDALPGVARNGPALLAFSSLGGPPDSLRSLERSLESAIQSLPPSAQNGARRDWLVRAATIAFPEYRLDVLRSTEESGLWAARAVTFAVNGNRQALRSLLAQVSAGRRWLRPADIMTDGLLPEAAALAQVGDDSSAIERLDPVLQAIRFTASQDLEFPTRAGPLVRAMALRADLAARTGDRSTARLWALAVEELWSNADPFLGPVVSRMRSLTR